VLGRLDSVIISGGENIAAEALEAQIAMHPAIAQVCVVGVPDAEWGERVTAVVELRKDAAGRDLADRAALEAWTVERISGFLRPKSWLTLNELPVLPSGKLDRRAIAALARTLLSE
jgi:O-succinylbenzoic acid--CoA ligase